MAGNDDSKGGSNMAQARTFTNTFVVIVGGGISGVCMAIRLLEKGIYDFVILEKSTGFGGTWKDNTYPGCCCDILSHLYCFSFEQNPDWSRLYPEQAEILEYMQGVAKKHNLYRHVRFASQVTGAHWDDAAQQWRVAVRVLAGKELEACEAYDLRARFFISAVGQLNEPYTPDIPGAAQFKGKTMHSARWDWSHDLAGKRVGIIGNGATAAQIVPELAKHVAQLTVFQRTPNWVLPRGDAPVAGWQRTLLRHVPYLLQRARALVMDEREAYFQSIVNKDSGDAALIRAYSEASIREQLPDRPDLWAKLTPDYPVGCKRIIMSDDYYPALRRGNVTLETRGIRGMSEGGVVVGGNEGEEEEVGLDVVVFATGFQTQEFLHGLDIRGAGGLSLRDIWPHHSSALYGVAVESLPNFGMLYGPNTNLGHNSIILMIESQARYLCTLIHAVHTSHQTSGHTLSLTPKASRVRAYNAQLQTDLAASSFADPRCASWYKTADGVVTNNWSGSAVAYQELLAAVDWEDFEVEGAGAEGFRRGGKSGKVLRIGRVVEETWVGNRTLAVAGVAVGVMLAGSAVVVRGLARGRRR